MWTLFALYTKILLNTQCIDKECLFITCYFLYIFKGTNHWLFITPLITHDALHPYICSFYKKEIQYMYTSSLCLIHILYLSPLHFPKCVHFHMKNKLIKGGINYIHKTWGVSSCSIAKAKASHRWLLMIFNQPFWGSLHNYPNELIAELLIRLLQFYTNYINDCTWVWRSSKMLYFNYLYT